MQQITANEIIAKLTPIFQEVLDDEALQISMQTTAQDVEGWDSLAHIRLVVSIEKLFLLRFSAQEVSCLENVGQMAELILNKLPN
jgi:acyl carrier protein